VLDQRGQIGPRAEGLRRRALRIDDSAVDDPVVLVQPQAQQEDHVASVAQPICGHGRRTTADKRASLLWIDRGEGGSIGLSLLYRSAMTPAARVA